MLIDFKRCYFPGEVVHFRLPYIVSFKTTKYRMTLCFRGDIKEFVLSDLYYDYKFNSVTPEVVKPYIQEWLSDPLNEIELLKEIANYNVGGNYKIVYDN